MGVHVMADAVLTLVGNLASDPEVRYTSNGTAVTSFQVASTPRVKDRASGEWRDGETLWMRCSVWRDQAERVAESLHKGDRVLVIGTLKQRQFEVAGEKRIAIELDVDEVAASLRYANVTARRQSRQAPEPAAPPVDADAAMAAAVDSLASITDMKDRKAAG